MYAHVVNPSREKTFRWLSVQLMLIKGAEIHAAIFLHMDGSVILRSNSLLLLHIIAVFGEEIRDMEKHDTWIEPLA